MVCMCCYFFGRTIAEYHRFNRKLSQIFVDRLSKCRCNDHATTTKKANNNNNRKPEQSISCTADWYVRRSGSSRWFTGINAMQSMIECNWLLGTLFSLAFHIGYLPTMCIVHRYTHTAPWLFYNWNSMNNCSNKPTEEQTIREKIHNKRGRKRRSAKRIEYEVTKFYFIISVAM